MQLDEKMVEMKAGAWDSYLVEKMADMKVSLKVIYLVGW